LEVAEALRDVLADATTKASRLVSVLRSSNKQKKALAALMSNLKQLNLGTEEPR
jgi:hypothetical protein